jgi:hypothetical protein
VRQFSDPARGMLVFIFFDDYKDDRFCHDILYISRLNQSFLALLLFEQFQLESNKRQDMGRPSESLGRPSSAGWQKATVIISDRVLISGTSSLSHWIRSSYAVVSAALVHQKHVGTSEIPIIDDITALIARLCQQRYSALSRTYEL